MAAKKASTTVASSADPRAVRSAPHWAGSWARHLAECLALQKVVSWGDCLAAHSVELWAVTRDDY